MSKGLLEVEGTLSAAQFWPNGTSDADTAHVVVSAFRFNGRVTHAFDDATVKRSATANGGKPVQNKKHEVTVRFQGIDAPELHYRPIHQHLSPEQKAAVSAKNGNFRQHLGESAAVALGKFVTALGPTPIACVVRSQVTKPNDVFDMYGRLIGDVYVQVGHQEINLNHWLLQHGYAFPAFYDSLTKQEIDDIQTLVQQAQSSNAGVWSHYTAKANEFDARRLAPKAHAPYSAARDQAAVSFPKLFRRASAWAVLKAAGVQSTRYIEYLRAHPDGCFTTTNFLAAGKRATRRRLEEFVDGRERFVVMPGGLVFSEGASFLVGGEGEGVEGW